MGRIANKLRYLKRKFRAGKLKKRTRGRDLVRMAKSRSGEYRR